MNKAIRNETQIARLTQYSGTHKSEIVRDLLNETLERGEINYSELGEMSNVSQPIEGLYLMGDPKFNPITNEPIYCVKVGLSYTSMSRRMNDYSTYNPVMYNQNYLYTTHDLTGILEELAQIQLNKVGQLLPNTKEWFRVSRETYLEIMEKGFTYFSIKA